MGILNLFETPIYSINLMNNPIKEALDALNIDEYVSKNHSWSCSVETGYFTDKQLPEEVFSAVFSTLLPHVGEFIQPYASSSDTKEKSITFTNIWLNRYDGSSYQDIHCHEGSSQLSFNYVYKTYEGASLFQVRDMSKQTDQFLKHIYGFSFSQDSHNFELQENDLLLFPSWLHHQVLKGEAEGERITLSGNIRIQC